MKTAMIVTILCVVGLTSRPGLAAPPAYDHIVVVMDENKSYSEIVNNANAPYITSLAAQGANMTHMFAEAHPSEPNYLALFSGSTQGVADDGTYAFTTPNLAHDLEAKGLTFTGYSESMPTFGYNGTATGEYARKHNAVASWQSATPTGNQVALADNQPYTSFPTSGNYASLPTVSFIDPNLISDMHDASVTTGDTWLQTNLDSYAQWAKTHNSLLIFTMDEDDGSQGNQIATIFVGQNVKTGNFGETINHYNLLRTIEDMYGLPYDTAAVSSAAPITDVFVTVPEPATLSLLALGGLGVLVRRRTRRSTKTRSGMVSDRFSNISHL